MRVVMASASQLAADLAVEAVHDARAGIGDEPHLAGLPRLEAHRRAGRNVEPEAARAWRDRSAAPRWSRRNDSASRPGSAGRRYWRPRARRVARPAFSSMSPALVMISPGIIGKRLLSGSAGAR